jgi:hypothetical protein
MKGVGRIYQQTFIDTYSKVTFAKLHDRKTPITAADLLNDRVVPFLSSDARCNTPCRFDIDSVDQDLRECCDASLFTYER